MGRRHLAIGVVIGAVVAGGIVQAAIPDSTSGQITACVVKSGATAGAVRIIDTATSSCRSTEKVVTWQAQGVRWRGAWSATKTYRTNDVVSRNGSSYVATASSTNAAPPNATKWAVFAAAGAAGATGASGPPGSTGATGPAGPSGPQHGRTIHAARTIVATPDTVGSASRTIIGLDGLPLVAYIDETNGAVKVEWCIDLLCSGSTSASLGTAISTTRIGLTLGANGLPLLAFGDPTANVVAVACDDPSCTTYSRSVIFATGQEAVYDMAITVGADGLPVIAAIDASGALHLMSCTVATCQEPELLTSTLVAATGAVSYQVDLTVDPSGLPIMSYAQYNGADLTTDLAVARCDDATCASVTTSTVTPDAGYFSSIVIASDGNPLISSYQGTATGLWITKCGDPDCAAATFSQREGSAERAVGQHTSMAIGPDGRAVIAHFDATNLDLVMSRCTDADCTEVTTEIIDAAGNVGASPSLAITPTGSAVISYYDSTDSDLRFSTVASLGWAANDWGS